jgi:hypothetical protein
VRCGAFGRPGDVLGGFSDVLVGRLIERWCGRGLETRIVRRDPSSQGARRNPELVGHVGQPRAGRFETF